MSAEATGWVWRNSPYSGAQLLVHLAIADVVNDLHENEFWMSTSTLATKAKTSRSTVVTTLSEMVQNGFLELIEAGGTSRTPTRYRFSTSPISGGSLGQSDGSTSAVSARNTKEPNEQNGASAVIGLAVAYCPHCSRPSPCHCEHEGQPASLAVGDHDDQPKIPVPHGRA